MPRTRGGDACEVIDKKTSNPPPPGPSATEPGRPFNLAPRIMVDLPARDRSQVVWLVAVPPSSSQSLPDIIVDTREQRPYEFPNSSRGTLRAGDYSLRGYEDRVAVERKSLADAYNSVGRHRARFRREWLRLTELEFAAVVIEASLPQLITSPPFRSGMHPRAVVSTYLGWSVEFRVPVYFAGDRLHGHAVVRKLLTMWWRYHARSERATAKQ